MVEPLSSMAVSMMFPLLALRHPDNMAATTSNSSKDTAMVLHPATAKDNHLDITKEAAIEANYNEDQALRIKRTTSMSWWVLAINRFLFSPPECSVIYHKRNLYEIGDSCVLLPSTLLGI